MKWSLLGVLGVTLILVVLASFGLLSRDLMFNALAFGIGSAIALSTMAVIFVPVLRPIIKQLRAMKADSLEDDPPADHGDSSGQDSRVTVN